MKFSIPKFLSFYTNQSNPQQFQCRQPIFQCYYLHISFELWLQYDSIGFLKLRLPTFTQIPGWKRTNLVGGDRQFYSVVHRGLRQQCCYTVWGEPLPGFPSMPGWLKGEVLGWEIAMEVWPTMWNLAAANHKKVPGPSEVPNVQKTHPLNGQKLGHFERNCPFWLLVRGKFPRKISKKVPRLKSW